MTEITKEIADARVYELSYLILPSLTEEQMLGVGDRLEETVRAYGHKLDGEIPEKIDLAYTMTHVRGASRYVVNEAYIGWIKFEAPPEKLSSLKEKISEIEEIIRFLIIKAPRNTDFTFAKARAQKIAERELAREEKKEEMESKTIAEEVLIQ